MKLKIVMLLLVLCSIFQQSVCMLKIGTGIRSKTPLRSPLTPATNPTRTGPLSTSTQPGLTGTRPGNITSLKPTTDFTKEPNFTDIPRNTTPNSEHSVTNPLRLPLLIEPTNSEALLKIEEMYNKNNGYEPVFIFKTALKKLSPELKNALEEPANYTIDGQNEIFEQDWGIFTFIPKKSSDQKPQLHVLIPTTDPEITYRSVNSALARLSLRRADFSEVVEYNSSAESVKKLFPQIVKNLEEARELEQNLTKAQEAEKEAIKKQDTATQEHKNAEKETELANQEEQKKNEALQKADNELRELEEMLASLEKKERELKEKSSADIKAEKESAQNRKNLAEKQAALEQQAADALKAVEQANKEFNEAQDIENSLNQLLNDIDAAYEENIKEVDEQARIIENEERNQSEKIKELDQRINQAEKEIEELSEKRSLAKTERERALLEQQENTLKTEREQTLKDQQDLEALNKQNKEMLLNLKDQQESEQKERDNAYTQQLEKFIRSEKETLDQETAKRLQKQLQEKEKRDEKYRREKDQLNQEIKKINISIETTKKDLALKKEDASSIKNLTPQEIEQLQRMEKDLENLEKDYATKLNLLSEKQKEELALIDLENEKILAEFTRLEQEKWAAAIKQQEEINRLENAEREQRYLVLEAEMAEFAQQLASLNKKATVQELNIVNQKKRLQKKLARDLEKQNIKLQKAQTDTKETLTEKKAQIEAEKNEILAQYDADLAKLEQESNTAQKHLREQHNLIAHKKNATQQKILESAALDALITGQKEEELANLIAQQKSISLEKQRIAATQKSTLEEKLTAAEQAELENMNTQLKQLQKQYTATQKARQELEQKVAQQALRMQDNTIEEIDADILLYKNQYAEFKEKENAAKTAQQKTHAQWNEYYTATTAEINALEKQIATTEKTKLEIQLTRTRKQHALEEKLTQDLQELEKLAEGATTLSAQEGFERAAKQDQKKADLITRYKADLAKIDQDQQAQLQTIENQKKEARKEYADTLQALYNDVLKNELNRIQEEKELTLRIAEQQKELVQEKQRINNLQKLTPEETAELAAMEQELKNLEQEHKDAARESENARQQKKELKVKREKRARGDGDMSIPNKPKTGSVSAIVEDNAPTTDRKPIKLASDLKENITDSQEQKEDKAQTNTNNHPTKDTDLTKNQRSSIGSYSKGRGFEILQESTSNQATPRTNPSKGFKPRSDFETGEQSSSALPSLIVPKSNPRQQPKVTTTSLKKSSSLFPQPEIKTDGALFDSSPFSSEMFTIPLTPEEKSSTTTIAPYKQGVRTRNDDQETVTTAQQLMEKAAEEKEDLVPKTENASLLPSDNPTEKTDQKSKPETVKLNEEMQVTEKAATEKPTLLKVWATNIVTWIQTQWTKIQEFFSRLFSK